ncbi:class I SAM-dependent methyltransferase [Altericroceibacterium spongiae]|uniref:Class I SAM-dependent methyltransferase n=1 Tax=Altericroceibacterium spongiae TaxID=2320269 RepID=A0A420EPF6_9SPHN|nr:SAM-dependent methyltransferase [Altericroceibacterium spongiae]RKF22551.1 class I SAM-dependent methyltransferase [Altericroceibacterium spongiae]
MSEQPLAETFRRLITRTGPISIQHYMGESNARYYAGKDPLGGQGDFITAPEISQMFGELIGLWLVDIWMRAGKPAPVHYVELGPGRGTLARDALRAMGQYGLSPEVHFVEGSAALRTAQGGLLPNAQFHDDLSSLPDDAPLLMAGNEFLDALPIRQLVKTESGWRERMVALEKESFICVAGQNPMDAALPEERRKAEEGTIIEVCPGASAVMEEVVQRLDKQGGAALLIDYGYDRVQTGSTLQAVHAHRKVDPFAMPGEADLTALVDFATLRDIVAHRGGDCLGVTTQGEWLRAMGIDHRAEALARRSPAHRESLQVAKDRLTGDDQMGRLFKVMGLAAPGWPRGAGFKA